MTDDETLTEQQRRIKEEYRARRGFWVPQDYLLQADPAFLKHYLNISAHPLDVLEPKMKHFIHIAIDCAVSHLHATATRAHIRMVLEDYGATFWEILQVIELTSTVGVHSAATGSKLLQEAVDDGESGEASAESNVSRTDQPIGDWDDAFRAITDFDEEWAQYAFDYWNHPLEDGPLSAVERELICVAVCVAPTYLNADAARIHIENALDRGASPEEIMAAIETASVLSMHSASDIVPILVEEATACEKLPELIRE